MSKILVVLESPNKEAKVQSYLGDKYLVTSSKGHIRDLDPNSLSIDVDNDFEPKYFENEDILHYFYMNSFFAKIN